MRVGSVIGVIVGVVWALLDALRAWQVDNLLSAGVVLSGSAWGPILVISGLILLLAPAPLAGFLATRRSRRLLAGVLAGAIAAGCVSLGAAAMAQVLSGRWLGGMLGSAIVLYDETATSQTTDVASVLLGLALSLSAGAALGGLGAALGRLGRNHQELTPSTPAPPESV